MKTIKASEASGAVLDRMVAKCEGYEQDRVFLYGEPSKSVRITNQPSFEKNHYASFEYSPSTNWAQGGPIIERGEITVQHTGDAAKWRAHVWDDERQDFWPTHYGPTPLIAAMRCYVSSRLGDVVEVPDELA